MINVRAPTNEKTQVAKEELHNLLEENINQIANLDIKVILGYFKAKVGKEDIYKLPTGIGSLFNETNNKRMKMIQFAISKVLM